VVDYDYGARKLRPWCRAHGITILHLSPQDYLVFLTDLLYAGYLYASANHTRSYLAMLHMLNQSPSPTESLLVRKALTGYQRITSAWCIRRRAITFPLLCKIRAYACTLFHGEMLLEVQSYLDACYGGYLRRHEAWDLTPKDLSPDCRGTRAFIASSKTDPLHYGAEALIFPDNHIKQLRVLRHQDARLWHHITPRIMLQLIRDANLGPGPYTIHSLRHGHATDAFRGGMTLPAIMTAGRWRSLSALQLYLHRSD